ncbi:MAG: DUF1206 domain-containing protein [Trueperaceae bacterium]|nr:DUF1206 domain-containing protein [Trueperaceae bacterium]
MRRLITLFCRLGYAAKGTLYLLIGYLALQVATGAGGQTTDKEGALYLLARQPFGRYLLGATALGLFGYTLWRVVQALRDVEHEGHGLRGIMFRIGFLVSGALYATIGIAAAQIVVRVNLPDAGDPQDWTAQLMAQPYGRWLVGAAGVIVVLIGLYQFLRAQRAGFRDNLLLRDHGGLEHILVAAGRLGYVARGVVYSLLGIFLVQAARQYEPSEAGGLGAALTFIAAQPYGPWLLGSVAVGLAVYGVFAVILSRYRRVTVR